MKNTPYFHVSFFTQKLSLLPYVPIIGKCFGVYYMVNANLYRILWVVQICMQLRIVALF